MAALVVTTRGIAGPSHPLGDGWVTIGRADENTFQIMEVSVSSRHCEVKFKNDELLVRDLMSTNGTFIDGKKISEGVLRAGQKLRLGEVELRLELSAAGQPPAPKAAVETKTSEGSAPVKKFHVLFVDDSLAFLETFGELCSALSNKTWDVHLATTADRALAALQEHATDLVVLDIGMPLVDGLQLLGIIRQRYPGIKIVVMTGSPSEHKRADALARGAELFMEKPVSPDGGRMVFNMLNDLMSWAHREGFTGALRQVGLPDVIQMECIARHSSILEIRNPQMHGQIYIESGVITHAVVGSLVGEKAVYRLLSLAGGEFQVKPFRPPPERTVQAGWEHLLMDAARVSDEETAWIKKTPGLSQTLPGSPSPQSPPETSGAGATKKYAVRGDMIVEVGGEPDEWKPADDAKK